MKSVLIIAVFFVIASCSTSRDYKKQYNREWKKLVRSQAWEDALVANTEILPTKKSGFEDNTGRGVVLESHTVKTNGYKDVEFNKKYEVLVLRAYTKIIAEAEASDILLTQEYERLNVKGQSIDPNYGKQRLLVNKRYRAHREMLQGLKSWNIFSEYGTDDLLFFKEENKKKVYTMYKNGKTDTQIVSFLVYRLADLYHLKA